MSFPECQTDGWNEGEPMPHVQVPVIKIQKALRSANNYKKLLTLVREMAREIERLDEDNAQLRAAVGIYREVVRRCNCKAASGPRDMRTAEDFQVGSVT